MYAQLLGLLLFACQIILNDSSVVHDSTVNVGGGETLTTQHSTLPEGYVAFPDVHAAYKVYQEGTTWYEARDRCIADNARLAIADTVQKIEHINSLKTSAYKWLHVGIYHSNATNQWVRVDNDQPLTSIAWISDNPDGTGDCAGISISENGLVDYQCDWSDEHFVCEISI